MKKVIIFDSKKMSDIYKEIFENNKVRYKVTPESEEIEVKVQSEDFVYVYPELKKIAWLKDIEISKLIVSEQMKFKKDRRKYSRRFKKILKLINRNNSDVYFLEEFIREMIENQQMKEKIEKIIQEI